MTSQDEITRAADLLKDALGAAADVMTGIGATPRGEHLFRTALREGQYPERSVPSRLRRNRLARAQLGWRLGVAASVAAALVAGIVVAVQPSAPTVLTAQLLADRASAAALARPAVSPGQWVYHVIEAYNPRLPKGMRTHIQAGWVTAGDIDSYGNPLVGAGTASPRYSQLGSLPRNPGALDSYLENMAGGAPDIKAESAFVGIKGMLSTYVLPPGLEAELYQALAVLPGVRVDSHVTVIDGQAGVAFVMPPTPQSVEQEIILNPSTYAYLAWASRGTDGAEVDFELAVLRTVIVGAPDSTQPSLTPPTAAELLAEQVDEASIVSPMIEWSPNLVPGTWILRELATSSGDKTVWATADDSEQASYVNGKLQACSRSAACAASTQWLMPAGPNYTLINPQGLQDGHLPPTLPGSWPPFLPGSLLQLLAALNSYSTGCTDVAGDCNAVNAIADTATGYANRIDAQHSWFLLLADIPGVTIQHATDVTGQADVAFRFPFTDGVTEILFNASTYQLVGYVRNGIETVITKEVAVTGPGSRTACPASSPGCHRY